RASAGRDCQARRAARQSPALEADLRMTAMAFKPNYNQQRADRNRAKAQKKQEKLKRLEEETAKRKAARAEQGDPDETPQDRWPRANMAKNQPIANGFVLFDVLSEDGTQTSDRRVPATELGGLDGDLPVAAGLGTCRCC